MNEVEERHAPTPPHRPPAFWVIASFGGWGGLNVIKKKHTIAMPAMASVPGGMRERQS